jgi:DNA-directed RNA polymerase specialized sigma24 family protein
VEQEDVAIRHLQLGAPDAFKVLFFQLYAEFFSFSTLLLQDGAAARQVTLGAFFLLWNRHADFDCEKAIKAFLYIAIRNRCLRQIRGLPLSDNAGGRDAVPSSLPPDILRDILSHTAKAV